jgi:hypothetical protein
MIDEQNVEIQQRRSRGKPVLATRQKSASPERESAPMCFGCAHKEKLLVIVIDGKIITGREGSER